MDPNEQEPKIVEGTSGQTYESTIIPDENLHGGTADQIVHKEEGIIYNAPYEG